MKIYQDILMSKRLKKMALKNYTTTIKIEKTMGEIETILANNGATHIFKMYNPDGTPIALAFKCIVNNQELSFKLPMEEDKILEVFRQQANKGKVPQRYKTDIDQARRTGWRIIKDWVDSQMALIEINLVTLDEVFLPYMYNQQLDKTMYQILSEKNFNLQLEDKR